MSEHSGRVWWESVKLIDQTLIPAPYLYLRGPQPSPPPGVDAGSDVRQRYDEACDVVRRRFDAGDVSLLDDPALFPASAEFPLYVDAPVGWSGAYGLVAECTPGPRCDSVPSPNRVLVKVLDAHAARGRVRPHVWCVLERDSGLLTWSSPAVDARWMGDTGRVLAVEWTAKDEPNGYWLSVSGSPAVRILFDVPEQDTRCAQDLASTECPSLWIVWLSDGQGASAFHVVRVDVGGAARAYCDDWNPWSEGASASASPTVTADGRRLAYVASDDTGTPHIFACDLETGLVSAYAFPRSLEPFLDDVRIHHSPEGTLRVFAPDGVLVAELSDEAVVGPPRRWRG